MTLLILLFTTKLLARLSIFKKKITNHNHDKYITTPEFNKLTSETFAARLKPANLASKSDIAHLVNKTDFNNKLTMLHQIKMY